MKPIDMRGVDMTSHFKGFVPENFFQKPYYDLFRLNVLDPHEERLITITK